MASSQYPHKLQIKSVGVTKDSLQLRDAATFLQDCTQLLQVVGLKTTVCQPKGKREINSPASIAFLLLTAANPCSATSSVTTSLLQLPRGSWLRSTQSPHWCCQWGSTAHSYFECCRSPQTLTTELPELQARTVSTVRTEWVFTSSPATHHSNSELWVSFSYRIQTWGINEIRWISAAVPYFFGGSRCLVFFVIPLVISRVQRLFPTKWAQNQTRIKHSGFGNLADAQGSPPGKDSHTHIFSIAGFLSFSEYPNTLRVQEAGDKRNMTDFPSKLQFYGAFSFYLNILCTKSVLAKGTWS